VNKKRGEWGTADDAMLHYESLPRGTAEHTCREFVGCLLDQRLDRDRLRSLLTEESADAWGDFQDAAKFFRAITGLGFATPLVMLPGQPCLKYAAVLDRVGEPAWNPPADQPREIPGFFTLVLSPERGWLVHAFGAKVPLEQMPPKYLTV
jgi:hypothetical protein